MRSARPEEEQRRSVDGPDRQQQPLLLPLLVSQDGERRGVREPRVDRKALAGHPRRRRRRRKRGGRRRRRACSPGEHCHLRPGESDERRLLRRLSASLSFFLFLFHFFVPRERGDPGPGLYPQEGRLLPAEIAAGRRRRRRRRRTAAALLGVDDDGAGRQPHPPGRNDAVRCPRGELCPAAATRFHCLGALPADAADAARGGGRGPVAAAAAAARFLAARRAAQYQRRPHSAPPLVIQEHGGSGPVRDEVERAPVQRARHGVDACGDVSERGDDGGIVVIGRG